MDLDLDLDMDGLVRGKLSRNGLSQITLYPLVSRSKSTPRSRSKSTTD